MVLNEVSRQLYQLKNLYEKILKSRTKFNDFQERTRSVLKKYKYKIDPDFDLHFENNRKVKLMYTNNLPENSLQYNKSTEGLEKFKVRIQNTIVCKYLIDFLEETIERSAIMGLTIDEIGSATKSVKVKSEKNNTQNETPLEEAMQIVPFVRKESNSDNNSDNSESWPTGCKISSSIPINLNLKL